MIFLGFSSLSVVVATYMTWTPAMMMRSFGWSPVDVGYAYGLILIAYLGQQEWR
jgi:hypothetical protein